MGRYPVTDLEINFIGDTIINKEYITIILMGWVLIKYLHNAFSVLILGEVFVFVLG